ncbi:MAG: ABC-F family ATP-binding cassette domain-containing protein, partial [Bacilli bacterium]|nr:ABC-F family ATP-binding cassette domain-containing protein [Bacilli bacterium]
AYYEKNHDKYFETNVNLIEWLRGYSEIKEESFVRGFLGRMLFSGEESLKKVNVLSGGEKVRCMFSKVMLEKGNVLLLDEPTNHLDIESITALNEGLKRYESPLIISTFDQAIIDTVCNRLIEIKKDGSYLDKQISYDEYLEKYGLDEKE